MSPADTKFSLDLSSLQTGPDRLAEASRDNSGDGHALTHVVCASFYR